MGLTDDSDITAIDLIVEDGVPVVKFAFDGVTARSTTAFAIEVVDEDGKPKERTDLVVEELLDGVSNVPPDSTIEGALVNVLVDAELGISNWMSVAIPAEADEAAGTDVIGNVVNTISEPFDASAGSCDW